MRWLLVMLIFVPISIVLHYMPANDSARFVTAALAILPLAGFMGTATEELAKYRGSAVGGLLNATFGNATELIIAIVAVGNGQTEVVRASLIGSIIGNILLVLGLSIFVGGLKHRIQHFNKELAGAHGSMMMMAVISFLVPALFVRNAHIHMPDASRAVTNLSIGVSTVLIVLYVGGLIFSLVTHESMLRDEEDAEGEHEPPIWSQKKCIGVLFVSTLFIALESEYLVHSIEPVVQTWHISKLFVGIILIPIIGNAAEHSTAILMAMRNKMEISLNIAVSSATQIAMFVAPVVVFASLWMHHPVSIIFSNVELIAVAVAVVLSLQVSRDGKSHWLEGAQLLATYVVIALAFYFVPG